MYYPMYFDSTYILVLIGAILCIAASAKVKSTYRKFSKVRNRRQMTGKEAAEEILHRSGIYDVRIEPVSGDLTDHYDSRNKVLRLSESVYGSASVAAVGVAAHECGHAVQHATGYVPLQMRAALVPVANFGSTIAWPLVLIGLFFNSRSSMIFITLGIILFGAAVLFQLVTLPVEFNASNRAIKILSETGMLHPDEVDGTRKVLHAAALTYVAGAAASILQLLRIILLSRGRRND